MFPSSAVEKGDRLETRELQASEVEVDVGVVGVDGGGGFAGFVVVGSSCEGEVDWVEEGEEVEER